MAQSVHEVPVRFRSSDHTFFYRFQEALKLLDEAMMHRLARDTTIKEGPFTTSVISYISFLSFWTGSQASTSLPLFPINDIELWIAHPAK